MPRFSIALDFVDPARRTAEFAQTRLRLDGTPETRQILVFYFYEPTEPQFSSEFMKGIALHNPVGSTCRVLNTALEKSFQCHHWRENQPDSDWNKYEFSPTPDKTAQYRAEAVVEILHKALVANEMRLTPYSLKSDEQTYQSDKHQWQIQRRMYGAAARQPSRPPRQLQEQCYLAITQLLMFVKNNGFGLSSMPQRTYNQLLEILNWLLRLMGSDETSQLGKWVLQNEPFVGGDGILGDTLSTLSVQFKDLVSQTVALPTWVNASTRELDYLSAFKSKQQPPVALQAQQSQGSRRPPVGFDSDDEDEGEAVVHAPSVLATAGPDDAEDPQYEAVKAPDYTTALQYLFDLINPSSRLYLPTLAPSDNGSVLIVQQLLAIYLTPDVPDVPFEAVRSQSKINNIRDGIIRLMQEKGIGISTIEYYKSIFGLPHQMRARPNYTLPNDVIENVWLKLPALRAQIIQLVRDIQQQFPALAAGLTQKYWLDRPGRNGSPPPLATADFNPYSTPRPAYAVSTKNRGGGSSSPYAASPVAMALSPLSATDNDYAGLVDPNLPDNGHSSRLDSFGSAALPPGASPSVSQLYEDMTGASPKTSRRSTASAAAPPVAVPTESLYGRAIDPIMPLLRLIELLSGKYTFFLNNSELPQPLTEQLVQQLLIASLINSDRKWQSIIHNASSNVDRLQGRRVSSEEIQACFIQIVKKARFNHGVIKEQLIKDLEDIFGLSPQDSPKIFQMQLPPLQVLQERLRAQPQKGQQPIISDLFKVLPKTVSVEQKHQLTVYYQIVINSN